MEWQGTVRQGRERRGGSGRAGHGKAGQGKAGRVRKGSSRQGTARCPAVVGQGVAGCAALRDRIGQNRTEAGRKAEQGEQGRGQDRLRDTGTGQRGGQGRGKGEAWRTLFFSLHYFAFPLISFCMKARFSLGMQSSKIRRGCVPVEEGCVPKWDAVSM